MDRLTKIYIASPYTVGDVAVNVHRQIETASVLISYGFNPYVPLMCHFQHMQYPREYAEWTFLMCDWLKSCDAVLRLPGYSEGADEEVKMALSIGMLVYFSIDDLVTAYKKGE